MEHQTYTVEQVVRETIDLLGGIMLPAALADTIGLPISQAIKNLNACCDAWARENAPERAESEE